MQVFLKGSVPRIYALQNVMSDATFLSGVAQSKMNLAEKKACRLELCLVSCALEQHWG